MIDETIRTHCDECGERLGNEDRAEVYLKLDPSPAVGMIIHASCYDPTKHDLA